MKRVLLDTNIYAVLLEDKMTADALLGLIPSEIIVYGSEVNRAELRDIETPFKVGEKSLRMVLLNLYDLLTQKENRTYRTTPFVEFLALQYFEEYVRLKGKKGYEELRKDFVIVATASIHALDLIVSQDVKTMLGTEARKAYEAVNTLNQLRTPALMLFQDFKKLLEELKNEN